MDDDYFPSSLNYTVERAMEDQWHAGYVEGYAKGYAKVVLELLASLVKEGN